ncbi:MAG TPA: tRNA guanosine(34) transglycosylase Tgt [Sedimentisphaerales bacterium]|nr:tRNA guanosine(34) transglycosylase Tgt [Sedimentisphaerales bacterium]
MESFKLINKDATTKARRGVLSTSHGQIQTPVFMPVGTAGAVKGTTPVMVEQTGAEIILANTYHMMIRPGVEIVEKIGGLHKMMAWHKPILTDSGGYQIFSLNSLVKIDDDGVIFASHADGSKYEMNAEIATNIQNRLGADIIMCFDQCAPYPCEKSQLQQAMERSIRWAARCKNAHANDKQLLFGIVQGGTDLEMRTHCVQELVKMDFPGYAIGGLSVGEGHEKMIETVLHTAAELPEDKPRYLMGVGTPLDIVSAVNCGIDMFDCVMPTRNGRNAYAFTEQGPVRLRNSCHSTDTGPIEENCDCYCCKNFPRATLRHFFNVGEMLGPIMVSLHNIRFYQRLMAKIRDSIEKNEFSLFVAEKTEKYRIFNN